MLHATSQQAEVRAMQASPTLRHHPWQDAALLALVTALALAAILALALAVRPVGGHVDLRWLSFQQELVRLASTGWR
jgi:hypothetical protein